MKSIKHIIKGNRILINGAKGFIRSSFYKLPYFLWVNRRAKNMASLPPQFVDIESTNACNAECIMCPHSRMRRKIGSMEWGLFEKVAEECARNNVKTIALNGFGEPLLDSLLTKRIKYLKNIGIPEVQIYTNGYLLDEDNAIKLIDSGLDMINICIDGVKHDTFEQIRKGLKFEVVERNVKKFLYIRKNRTPITKHRKPILYIGFINIKEKEAEKEAFLRKWSPIADGIYVSLPNNWRGNVVIDDFPSLLNSVHLTDISSPCTVLWQGIYIQYNGDVIPCCADYEGDFVIGNMKTQSISDIWWGNELKHLREEHLNGKRKELALCKNCSAPHLLSPTAWWHV